MYIINRRAYRDKSDYTRNGYHLISMFSPIYAALSNPKGAPGDIMFRKTAYELLAEKDPRWILTICIQPIRRRS